MPVRKIPICYVSHAGQVALKRLPGCVKHESLLERDFIFLADFDPFVATIEGQPVRIYWRDSRGREHRYTPDFLLTFKPPEHRNLPLPFGRSRPWLVEVKNNETLKKDWIDFRPRFLAATAYAKARNWTFHLRDERRIKTPLLENANLLLPMVRLQTDPVACDLLLNTLGQRGDLTVDELATAALQSGFPCRTTLMTALWNLVARHIINADLRRAISMKTRLTMNRPDVEMAVWL